MGHLWEALTRAYDALGFAAATGGDAVFRDLVVARIIKPSSKLGAATSAAVGRSNILGRDPQWGFLPTPASDLAAYRLLQPA